MSMEILPALRYLSPVKYYHFENAFSIHHEVQLKVSKRFFNFKLTWLFVISSYFQNNNTDKQYFKIPIT